MNKSDKPGNPFPGFTIEQLTPINTEPITPQPAPIKEQLVEIALHNLQVDIFNILYDKKPNIGNLARIGLKVVNMEHQIESITRRSKSQKLNIGFVEKEDEDYQISKARTKKLNDWLNWKNRI